MKKIILLLLTISICLCSCTEQERTRIYGGEMTINLPAGQELMSVTWEDNHLLYLTRPMTSDYVPRDLGLLSTKIGFDMLTERS